MNNKKAIWFCILFLLGFQPGLIFAADSFEDNAAVQPDSQLDNHDERQLKSVSLPGAFQRFSAADVLKCIYADYAEASGQTANTVKPAKVLLADAIDWEMPDRQAMAVLIRVETPENRVEGGYESSINVIGYALAILEQKAEKLSLLAYQEESALKKPVLSGYAYFDATQYRLSENEALIGYRIFKPGAGYGNDLLRLFRIEIPVPRKIFEHNMTEVFAMEEGYFGGKLILLSVPNSQGVNDFLVKSRPSVTNLPIDDADLDNAEYVFSEQPVRELWRFDGKEYKKLK